MVNASIILPFYIGSSEGLNGIRCLKAARNIKKGELLEECPIILIPMAEYEDLSQTTLAHYEFEWDKDHEAMVLGYGCIFNHSFQANVHYKKNKKRKTMSFIAARDIKKDEELLTNYNGNDEPPAPLDENYLNFKY